MPLNWQAQRAWEPPSPRTRVLLPPHSPGVPWGKTSAAPSGWEAGKAQQVQRAAVRRDGRLCQGSVALPLDALVSPPPPRPLWFPWRPVRRQQARQVHAPPCFPSDLQWEWLPGWGASISQRGHCFPSESVLAPGASTGAAGVGPGFGATEEAGVVGCDAAERGDTTGAPWQ